MTGPLLFASKHIAISRRYKLVPFPIREIYNVYYENKLYI